MPAPLGHPRYGGRQKGTRNKPNQIRDQVIARASAAVMAKLPDELRAITPLEALLLCMRWALAEHDRAGILAAASAAAPYCHARLANAEVRVRNEAAGMSDEELKAEIALLEARIAETNKIH